VSLNEAASRDLSQSMFADKSWSPIDSSGPREILKIVERKVQDGTIEKSRRPDKFWRSHAYQQMYGMYLLPYVELHHQKSKPVKFLEIGLGCVDGGRTEGYAGLFSGLTIWKEIFDVTSDELWIGEYDKVCVDNVRNNSDYLKNINVVTGDQGDVDTLERWIVETGGSFDIVVDDGAHLNTRIYNSFVHLWPQVKPGMYHVLLACIYHVPSSLMIDYCLCKHINLLLVDDSGEGGLYFIEDMHVVRNAAGTMFGDVSLHSP
jgi:hypothetical protein